MNSFKHGIKMNQLTITVQNSSSEILMLHEESNENWLGIRRKNRVKAPVSSSFLAKAILLNQNVIKNNSKPLSGFFNLLS
jgi:hypothetical protein